MSPFLRLTLSFRHRYRQHYHHRFGAPFLDASSHLYKRVCPSVRPSVCAPVIISVNSPKTVEEKGVRLKKSFGHIRILLKPHQFAYPGLFFFFPLPRDELKTQGKTWVRNMEKKNDLVTTQLTHKMFRR